jgi:muconolactone delta-isomerase
MYFFKVRVDHSKLSTAELWDLWEKEIEAAESAMDAGKIKNLYKVSGQRRVMGVIDAESHDELDRIMMAGLPRSWNGKKSFLCASIEVSARTFAIAGSNIVQLGPTSRRHVPTAPGSTFAVGRRARGDARGSWCHADGRVVAVDSGSVTSWICWTEHLESSGDFINPFVFVTGIYTGLKTSLVGCVDRPRRAEVGMTVGHARSGHRSGRRGRGGGFW